MPAHESATSLHLISISTEYPSGALLPWAPLPRGANARCGRRLDRKAIFAAGTRYRESSSLDSVEGSRASLSGSGRDIAGRSARIENGGRSAPVDSRTGYRTSSLAGYRNTLRFAPGVTIVRTQPSR